MPRESAVQLLLSRQPPYSSTNTVALTVEDLGPPVWHISLNSPPPDFVDSINLDFAPPPTKSTVLSIHRSVSYVTYINGAIVKRNSDAPSVENFVRSLAEKFRSPTPTVVESRSANPGVFNITDYVWTRAGEFLSSAELNRRLRYPKGALTPPTLDAARTNVGTDFHLYLDDKNFEDTCGTAVQVVWTQEGGIIRQFEMTLSDAAGLVLAFSKSAALIDAKKGTQHQQELQRAKQNRPKL